MHMRRCVVCEVWTSGNHQRQSSAITREAAFRIADDPKPLVPIACKCPRHSRVLIAIGRALDHSVRYIANKVRVRHSMTQSQLTNGMRFAPIQRCIDGDLITVAMKRDQLLAS